jgi:hypothetical protein
MKLFLEIPDGIWEKINKLLDAKRGNTIPARDFIIRACNRALGEAYERRLFEENEHERFMRGHPWIKSRLKD